MPPRERERERSRRRRGPRGGDPNRPSQLSRRERGLPTEDRTREADRDTRHRDRRVERGRDRERDSGFEPATAQVPTSWLYGDLGDKTPADGNGRGVTTQRSTKVKSC